MGNAVIYRPAYDAEVEYLESTGTQWIDTGIVFNSAMTIEMSFMLTRLNEIASLIFGAFTDNNSSDRLQLFINSYHQFATNESFKDVSGISIGDVATINTVYNITYTTKTQVDATFPMWLFARSNNYSHYLPYNGLRVYSFKINETDSGTVLRDFIPVRIGQIGYMYDKVTKQLFANKGTGNFILGNDVSNAVIPQQRCVLYFDNQRSVIYERIYEEYDWLCGRNGAYIDTNYYPIVGTDVFSVHFHYDGTIRNPDGVEQCIFGCQNGPYGPTTIRAYINGANYLSVNYHNTSGNYFPSTNVNANNWEIADLKLAESNFSFVANGVTYTFSNNDVQIETVSNSIWVFKNLQTYNSNCYFHGDIAYFKITDTSSNTKMNLIPCKLLQSIPAILDGNGIARQAGECGMWDKVSNRFYGNVASSGTFTVKGPKCYEEYKWLIIPYTQNDANALPIKSNNFSYQYIIYSVGNIAGVWTENTKYTYYPKTTKCSIWGSSERIIVHSNSNLIPLATPFDVECNSDGITMNGELMPNYGSSPYFDRLDIYCYTSTGQYALSKITVDGSVRYVPCKLTHGIPASMDANGIARPAGTCGMWDKVNDKFYGNVANSGTFTVSND